MKTSFLQVENLEVTRNKVTLLSNISFDLKSMEILSIVGAKGAGKGLLVKTLLGIQRGEVRGRIQKMGQQRFGLVSNKYSCVENISIFENLALVSRMAGVDLQVHLAEEVEENLKLVGLWGEIKNQLRAPVSELSEFQKIRLNLCRTLLFKPTILILDQPTLTLDPVKKARFEAIIEELKSSMSILWVNHDLEQVARVSDQVLFLENGRMMECSSCEEFFTMPQLESTENFISRRMNV